MVQTDLTPDPLEGTEASTSVGDTELLLTYRDPDGNPVDDDKVVATVMDLEIVASGDYIVPGSSLNTIQYTITPPDLQFDSVKLEILNDSQSVVRTEGNLPTSNGAPGYAEYQWDGQGRNQSDQLYPLTATGSPYSYRLVADKNAAMTVTAEETQGGRQVIAFYMTLIFSDEASFVGALVSGMDESTITAARVTQMIQPWGGNATQIQYLCTSTVGGTDVDAILQNSGASQDYYLFYATPVTPYSIRYAQTIAVSDDGALDNAANLWDMDGNDGNGRQTVGLWEYGIDGNGDFLQFDEDYQQ